MRGHRGLDGAENAAQAHRVQRPVLPVADGLDDACDLVVDVVLRIPVTTGPLEPARHRNQCFFEPPLLPCRPLSTRGSRSASSLPSAAYIPGPRGCRLEDRRLAAGLAAVSWPNSRVRCGSRTGQLLVRATTRSGWPIGRRLLDQPRRRRAPSSTCSMSHSAWAKYSGQRWWAQPRIPRQCSSW